MKTNSHAGTSLVKGEVRRPEARRTLKTAIGFLLLALLGMGLLACSRSEPATAAVKPILPADSPTKQRPQTEDAALTQHLQTISKSVSGDIGVAVIHVETGRSVEVDGKKVMPLYSVYKLPLAIAVLKEVEEGYLALDRKVHVTPDDVAPGSQANADLWRQPVDKTVAELLEYSIVRSDNTSTDKLLPLVTGPLGVTGRMRAWGFSSIDIKYSSREFAAHRDKPNTATASDLTQLLSKLQKGELLKAPQVSLLLGFMEKARTGGERRIRANLPEGTQVAEKTGTGEDTTNDVGLITLPEGKGHLAIAVLIKSSKLSAEAKEKVIAELARAAYDSFVAMPARLPSL